MILFGESSPMIPVPESFLYRKPSVSAISSISNRKAVLPAPVTICTAPAALGGMWSPVCGAFSAYCATVLVTSVKPHAESCLRKYVNNT